MPLFRKMETRRLENTDMKKLVRTLRGVPSPYTLSNEAHYRKHAKHDIKSLPLKLRTLNQHLSTRDTHLCDTHKHLDHNLIKDIWSWMRHELDGAIGCFLYPVIMCNALTPAQELRARQLEPVLEMWRQDFKIETSAPPGRSPIRNDSKWQTQHDGCAACMLARIGSDEDVLFALFAGMAGRMRRQRGSHSHRREGRHGGEDRERIEFRALKSKRLRFVRYWIMAYGDGERRAWDAWQFGQELKRARKKWRRGGCCEGSVYPPWSEVTNPTAGGGDGGESFKDVRGPVHDDEEVFNPGVDISEPFNPKDWSRKVDDDAKLGPLPRPYGLEPTTPAEKVGFDIPSRREKSLHEPSSSSTLRTDSDTQSRNDSVHNHRQARSRNQAASRRPPSSIYSRPSGFHPNGFHADHPPLPDHPNPVYDRYRDANQANTYNTHTHTRNPYDDPKHPIPANLPKPRPQSIYSAYGDVTFDEEAYAVVDVSPPLTPTREEWEWEKDGDEDRGRHMRSNAGRGMSRDRGGRGASRCTTWGEFCR
ncbi:hypothetical protein P153DRAFT_362049 [Dothidotthia symphoricarpi CBS 119687]|uniref:Uncharacterized protein n=1 Tax=Dothidotthia symphoricarpi CBS 119687 TaxID=1392245 RepID=A0A6A5ZYU6_9PLEO|nr:uncharacterized protein P153DRAFT_362049 [Dothidotthia symphoricarpi CBS 119687]KAF2123491.1 hypothetical protein P153DRAFT_362049 [Dothidotthia symphoricarpi CBS 119687]